MPNTHTTLTSLFSDIADAIRGKTGSSATIVADDFPTAIASIPTGGGSATIEPLSVTVNGTYTAPSGVDGYSPITVNVPKNGVTTTEEPNSTGTTLYINSTGGGDVRFIDYDGTILYSYSASEFANLTEMPANPTHTGLTSQGWNWSLADAKAQMVAQPNDTLTIGQMYVTNDGKTRLYISLVDSTRLSPYLGVCPNGTVVVDWGDNTATNTLTGTSLAYTEWTQHTYASTGDYVITLTATSGSFAIMGTSSSSSGSNLLTRISSTFASQRCYQVAIKKVELGANVLISPYAFNYCFSLTSITIPSGISIGNYTFSECRALTSITIPSGATDVNTSICYNCFALTNVAIPSSVMTIKNSAFYNCYSLTSIAIPSGVTSIGNSAFRSCLLFTNITIPSGVTSIGSEAFHTCVSITNIVIPSNVTSISSYTFSNCYALKSITLPSGLTSIGDNACYSCQSLTSITIPSGVTSIGQNAFSNCYVLKSVTIPSGVTTIANYAFSACYSLSSVIIPSNVTAIGTYAFQNCRAITNIAIPSGVTSIGRNAFYNCNSLTNITIPSGVTSIEQNAFYACNSLSSVIIPSNVTAIDTYAFQNCDGVAEYHFLSTTPPTLANTNAFSGILSDCKIYVPAASLTTYQEATNWSTYASYMVGE